jgi:hypothetical protein
MANSSSSDSSSSSSTGFWERRSQRSNTTTSNNKKKEEKPAEWNEDIDLVQKRRTFGQQISHGIATHCYLEHVGGSPGDIGSIELCRGEYGRGR